MSAQSGPQALRQDGQKGRQAAPIMRAMCEASSQKSSDWSRTSWVPHSRQVNVTL